MRNLTLKEYNWKESQTSRPETERLLMPKVKKLNATVIDLPKADFRHIRHINVVKDEGYLLDPNNFKARIPKPEHNTLYERKSKVLGVYTTIEDLLKTAKLKFGDKDLQFLYLVTGKRVKSFVQIPLHATHIVVSNHANMKGVGCGNLYKDMPSTLRKKVNDSPTDKISRSVSRKILLPRRLTTRAKIAGTSVPRKRSGLMVPSPSKLRGADESLDRLRKDYPLNILTKLMMIEKHNKKDDSEFINDLAVRTQNYETQIKKIMKTPKFHNFDVQLRSITKTNSESSIQTRPKTSLKTLYLQDDSKSSRSSYSGFESTEENDDAFSTYETEGTQEVNAPLMEKYRRNTITLRKSLLVNPRTNRREHVAKQIELGLNQTSTGFMKIFVDKFGLTTDTFQLCYAEFTTLLSESIKNHKQLALWEILSGQYEEEVNAISWDYLITNHNFFTHMPDSMKNLVHNYFQIDNVIKIEVWMSISSILIYRFCRRSCKIDFLSDFLPLSYRQFYKLLRANSLDKEAVIELMLKLISLHCFDSSMNLDRERIRECMRKSDIKADDILSLLTRFSDI